MAEETALIVEDQVIIALDLKNILKKCGITCSKIIDKGCKALDFLDENNPSIAFLDIKLADSISGVEIAAKLKSKGVPFIFISAFSNPENLKLAKQLKPYGIIHKPFDQDKIQELIYKFKSWSYTI